MKAYLGTSLLFAILLLLPACASTQKTAYAEAPALKAETMVQDHRYVAVVERFAKQRGTRVVWVNPPRKRVAQTVAASH